jgi:hypothetical protein
MIKSTTKPKENWDEQKAKLKAKILILTDTSMNYTENEKEEVLKKMQIKLGKTKEELLKIISTLLIKF